MSDAKGSGRNWFIWLLVCPVLFVAAANVTHLWVQTASPVDNANPESLAVYWARQVAEGKPLYTDFRNWPYNITSFGPVYYFALSNLTRWFHLTLEDMFVWGRRLVLACCIAIAFLIYWNGKRDTGDRTFAFLGSLLFLSSYSLWPVASVCRPDLLAAFFSICGFLIYSLRIDRSFRMVALPLFVLAFFTKLSYVSAPASICIYHLIRRNWKEGLTIAALYGLSVLLIAAAMHIATHGLSTLNSILSNIAAPMKLLNIRIVSSAFLQQAPLAVMLSFLGLVAITWKELKGIYFLVSLLSATLSSAKMGSGVNYFLEPLMVGCFLVAPALQTFSTFHVQENRARTYLHVLLAALFWVLMLPSFNYLLHTLQTLRFTPESEVRQLAREASGFVLTDNPRLSLISRAPMLGDPFTLSCLETRGLWNSKELARMLHRHQIQYVILYMPIEQPSSWQGFKRLPKSVIDTIQSEYRLLRIVDNHYIYIPRS